MLAAAYIVLTLLINLFLLRIGLKAIPSSAPNSRRRRFVLVVCLLLWQVFILAISSTDVLMSFDFPPRFALAFIIPSFIFSGVFLYRSRQKDWPHLIPESWIVYFQSFRILVESLFILSLSQEIFNPEVTLEGYNFDMIFALSAPLIAYLVYKQGVLPRQLLIYWNYLGLAVLCSVILLFALSIYRPQIFGSSTPLLPMAAMTYPFVLIASFMMPAAVFLHLLSIVQLRSTDRLLTGRV